MLPMIAVAGKRNRRFNPLWSRAIAPVEPPTPQGADWVYVPGAGFQREDSAIATMPVGGYGYGYAAPFASPYAAPYYGYGYQSPFYGYGGQGFGGWGFGGRGFGGRMLNHGGPTPEGANWVHVPGAGFQREDSAIASMPYGYGYGYGYPAPAYGYGRRMWNPTRYAPVAATNKKWYPAIMVVNGKKPQPPGLPPVVYVHADGTQAHLIVVVNGRAQRIPVVVHDLSGSGKYLKALVSRPGTQRNPPEPPTAYQNCVATMCWDVPKEQAAACIAENCAWLKSAELPKAGRAKVARQRRLLASAARRASVGHAGGACCGSCANGGPCEGGCGSKCNCGKEGPSQNPGRMAGVRRTVMLPSRPRAPGCWIKKKGGGKEYVVPCPTSGSFR